MLRRLQVRFLTQCFHFLFSRPLALSQINKYSRATSSSSSSSETMTEEKDNFYILNFSSGNVSELFQVKLSLVIAIFYR